MKLAEQNLFKSNGLGGRTGTVASVLYYRPWGPWFETWPGSRSLWPCASHIYPLFSTNPGQVGLGSSRPESTRPGQLGRVKSALYIRYSCVLVGRERCAQ